MRRYPWQFALIFLLLTTLACSLGTGAEPTPAATQQLVPTRAVPTLPPVAMVSPSPMVPPSPTVRPSETPLSGTGPGGCVLKIEFVADVTIPDNTILAPSAAFVKTWRIRNNGTCNWDSYQLVFAEGNQMGGPAAVNINPTAPNNTVDVSVNLVAPAAPGNYSGRWRLRASNGIIFGGLTVVIQVPATPTPTATITPTLAPTIIAGQWNGKWVSDCGAANCGVVQLVQTGSTVTGTYAANGTVSGTVIGNRLTGTWQRNGVAGSIDWWMGGTGVKWRGNYDAINAWCGHRDGETNPAPCGTGTLAGDWNVLCTGCDGTMRITQDGRNFTGTYPNGTLDGTIDGTTATGTWRHTNGTSGPFTWYLVNGQQFNGNWGGTNQWCGFRTGSGAPTPCLK